MGTTDIAPPFFISALDGVGSSASLPSRYTPRDMAALTHWTGGWVGPSVGLDAVEQEKSLATASNRAPAVQSVARHYTNWVIPAEHNKYTYIMYYYLLKKYI
jgi:hypothetical protein